MVVQADLGPGPYAVDGVFYGQRADCGPLGHRVYSARQPRHIKSTNSLHTYARCNQSPWELLRICIYYELLGFLLLRRAWPLPINKDQTPIYQSIYHYHPKETHQNKLTQENFKKVKFEIFLTFL